MEQFINLITTTEVNLVGSIFKLFLSLVLGAAIGFERRHKGQIAGMRTFALIAMGSTLAMLISIYIPQEYMGLKNGDPGRIAAQVISGIGFLGAGAIIQMKGAVRGLTTAAGIWVTACIGLAVGSGMYIVAVSATFFILFVLLFLESIERWWLNGVQSNIVRVKVGKIVDDTTPYRDCFEKHKVHISKEFLRYDYTQGVTTINYLVRSVYETDFIKLFADINKLGEIHSLTLTNEVNN